MPWPTVPEKLAARLVPDPGTGCLLWTGMRTRDGYGVICDGPWPRPVHRVAWELANGPIPEGMTIDHVYARGCRHRNCANVDHLEPVTQSENSLRAWAVRRGEDACHAPYAG